MGLLKKLLDHEYKEMKKFKKLADEIVALEDEYSKKSDDELKNKTIEFKERLSKGETLDDILVEAYATAREVFFHYAPLMRALFVETNPIPVKAAMAMKGMIKEEYRLPLCELSASARAKLVETMKNY